MQQALPAPTIEGPNTLTWVRRFSTWPARAAVLIAAALMLAPFTGWIALRSISQPNSASMAYRAFPRVRAAVHNAGTGDGGPLADRIRQVLRSHPEDMRLQLGAAMMSADEVSALSMLRAEGLANPNNPMPLALELRLAINSDFRFTSVGGGFSLFGSAQHASEATVTAFGAAAHRGALLDAGNGYFTLMEAIGDSLNHDDAGAVWLLQQAAVAPRFDDYSEQSIQCMWHFYRSLGWNWSSMIQLGLTQQLMSPQLHVFLDFAAYASWLATQQGRLGNEHAEAAIRLAILGLGRQIRKHSTTWYGAGVGCQIVNVAVQGVEAGYDRFTEAVVDEAGNFGEVNQQRRNFVGWLKRRHLSANVAAVMDEFRADDRLAEIGRNPDATEAADHLITNLAYSWELCAAAGICTVWLLVAGACAMLARSAKSVAGPLLGVGLSGLLIALWCAARVSSAQLERPIWFTGGLFLGVLLVIMAATVTGILLLRLTAGMAASLVLFAMAPLAAGAWCGAVYHTAVLERQGAAQAVAIAAGEPAWMAMQAAARGATQQSPGAQ
ncbi:MAG: hypothetical protein KGJ62_09690 [Armatimonadetes bacterium]|nr:hypothetical protein [Armatimonadota bacterium]MDE2205782.1 hypothetical protein [Armatimonadota bacterium]